MVCEVFVIGFRNVTCQCEIQINFLEGHIWNLVPLTFANIIKNTSYIHYTHSIYGVT